LAEFPTIIFYLKFEKKKLREFNAYSRFTIEVSMRIPLRIREIRQGEGLVEKEFSDMDS
jgi:hypothetical protein